ncbi:Malonyl CoA-acyl carrier protein transacylase [Kluyvera cryocrescens]|uniref:[acyl-carrier-protein] S-malonyltransferase n=2 Tax=Kluyvera cryocrescens TaxID=580 RepID=A0A485C9B5_KLUCR|nr:Malonyl CoA-acyl carrier protein transacylase [Kluyvera cryocrescens]
MGAGAVVLGASEEQGIISTHLHADGSYGKLLTLPNADRVNPDNSIYLTMAGNEVFKVAVTELRTSLMKRWPPTIWTVLNWTGWCHTRRTYVLSGATAKKLGMSMDNVVVTLDRHGNTSAASVPCAFDEAVRDGRIKRGQLVLLGSFRVAVSPGALRWFVSKYKDKKMTQFAFVFPGQGSQAVGMLSELAATNPVIEETFHEASAALGYDLWALTQQGPAEELNKTWQTQPALLTASVALFRLWQQQGGKAPALLAGHSLGEYSALVCAGVIPFADAVRLVEMRGKFMQEAVPEGTGGMSAIIGLDDASIAKACEESAEGQVVSPVNFNSPGQVVIAGHKEAVERAGAACKAAGAKRALPLPVSVPSHCALMKPAAEKLAVELQKITFSAPTISVVNNVDVKCETDANAIRDALVRQLYSPVQWTKTVEFMASQGVEHLYEVGPGKVLTGLTKRIVDTLTASAINEPVALSAALAQ